MPRIYRGPRAYGRKPKPQKPLRRLVIPCLCGSVRWDVDLANECATCQDCGTTYSKSFWHPQR